MPCFVGTVGVTVVFFEQSQWLALVRTDYDLSLFTCFNGTPVIVYQVNIVLRVRQPHAARFGFHPGHGSNGEGRFGLSETFHQLDACQFFEGFEYGGIQCLSGNGTIFQGRKVVLCQVLVDKKTEYGWRCAEGSDVIILYFLQYIGGGELLMVVHEYIGACNPLTVKFSPYGFSPAGIGDGEVQALFCQIMPETACDDMSQWISKVMGHHFRFTGSSAGEIHQGDVIVGVRLFRFDKRSGSLDSFMEVLESFGYFRAYADKFPDGG